MGYFDFYHKELSNQQIDELHGIMATHEAAGMRPYDAALQAVRDKLQQARENQAEVKRLVFESISKKEIDAGAHQAATSPKNDLPEPTPAQQAAGNYPKGSIYLYGLDIAIENPEGSTRKGVSPDGKAWTSRMYHHYGYIRKTEGADGDHVDVFLGSQPSSEKVFVIDQVNPDGKFDEHKVMLAFRTLADARKGYQKNYEEGWTGLGAITEMSVDEFKEWLKSGDTLKPVDGAILEAAFAIYESALAGEFIKAPNGSVNFGEITPAIAKEIRRQAGFIRMRKGSIETRGEDHINRVARKAQIRNAGFKDAVDVVYAIASGYTAIYKGSAGRLLLVNANKKTVSAYIELTPALDGDYYDVETAFPIHGKYLKNKELLWGDAPDHQHHSLAPSAFSGQSNSLSDDSTLPLTPDAVKPVLEAAGGAYDYRTAIEQATTFEDIQAVFARVFPGHWGTQSLQAGTWVKDKINGLVAQISEIKHLRDGSLHGYIVNYYDPSKGEFISNFANIFNSGKDFDVIEKPVAKFKKGQTVAMIDSPDQPAKIMKTTYSDGFTYKIKHDNTVFANIDKRDREESELIIFAERRSSTTQILHTFPNEDDGVAAIVAKVSQGYSVVLKDTDADEIAQTAKIFPNRLLKNVTRKLGYKAHGAQRLRHNR